MIKGPSRGYQPIELCGIIGKLSTMAFVTDGAGAKGLRWYERRWLSLAQPLHRAWRRWLWQCERSNGPDSLRGVGSPRELSGGGGADGRKPLDRGKLL
jgi:hypothetical protein